MLKNVLLATALFVAVALASDFTCPDFTGTMNAYAQDSLPSNCSSIRNCTQTRCECMSQQYDSQAVMCSGTTAEVGCDLAYFCYGQFTQCLLVHGIADDCGEWSAFLKDAYVEFLVADQLTYNNTALFSACANSACHFLNDTDPTCLEGWSPVDTCFQAVVNESNLLTRAPVPRGVTPVPRGPGGKFTQDVTQIIARIKFNGDFAAIFSAGNTSAKAKALGVSLRDTLAAFLHYEVELIQLFEGSLVSDFSVSVPASDPNLAAAIQNNIGQMTNGGNGNKWFQALEDACKANGGCPFGITSVVSFVTAVYLVRGVAGPSGGGTVQSTCETRCIAFIVIGIVVTITIIIAALLIYKHRVDAERQGTGQTVKPDSTGDRDHAENPLA